MLLLIILYPTFFRRFWAGPALSRSFIHFYSFLLVPFFTPRSLGTHPPSFADPSGKRTCNIPLCVGVRLVLSIFRPLHFAAIGLGWPLGLSNAVKVEDWRRIGGNYLPDIVSGFCCIPGKVRVLPIGLRATPSSAGCVARFYPGNVV
jgi:hypothetical protein